MTNLWCVAQQFHRLGEELDKQVERCDKASHLARHVADAMVSAGRLMIDAIDQNAFPIEEREKNHGWWDRSVGRFPGGQIALYGSIQQALLKTTQLKSNLLPGKLISEHNPDQQAIDQYRIDAMKPFEPEQFARSWQMAFGSWLVMKFPERFIHRAASWDSTHVSFDEYGRPVDKYGRAVKGHWYRDGELLPGNFQWHPSLKGKYEWKLDAKLAKTTDDYAESDWLAHHRIRATEHAKACRLMAELIGEDPPVLSPTAAAVYEILLALPTHRGLMIPDLITALKGQGIHTETSTLTSRIIPELKPYGIESSPRKGYRIPESKRPDQMQH